MKKKSCADLNRANRGCGSFSPSSRSHLLFDQVSFSLYYILSVVTITFFPVSVLFLLFSLIRLELPPPVFSFYFYTETIKGKKPLFFPFLNQTLLSDQKAVNDKPLVSRQSFFGNLFPSSNKFI